MNSCNHKGYDTTACVFLFITFCLSAQCILYIYIWVCLLLKIGSTAYPTSIIPRTSFFFFPSHGLRLARTRGPIKLSLWACWQERKEKSCFTVVQTIVSFHTRLSTSFNLIFHRISLAPVQVWTQYSYWDHGSHLLACTERPQLPLLVQTAVTNITTSFILYKPNFLFYRNIAVQMNTIMLPYAAHGLNFHDFWFSIAPMCNLQILLDHLHQEAHISIFLITKAHPLSLEKGRQQNKLWGSSVSLCVL